MKKKNIILCAGVLSIAMLCGCEVTIKNENPTDVTAEATQEAVETPEVTETVTTPEATQTFIEDEEQITTAESNNIEDYNYTAEEYASEEITTQEDMEEETDSYADFASLMTAIYEVDTNSTDVESIAKQLKDYAFTYGAPSTSSVFESMANDWFDTMKATEGKDIRFEFSECFNTVTSTAQQMDEDLEFDVSYLNVINGIIYAAMVE